MLVEQTVEGRRCSPALVVLVAEGTFASNVLPPSKVTPPTVLPPIDAARGVDEGRLTLGTDPFREGFLRNISKVN